MTGQVSLVGVWLLVLFFAAPAAATSRVAGALAPAWSPGVQLQPKAVLALQESAPAAHPWTPVLLSAGAEPLLAAAPASVTPSANAPAASPAHAPFARATRTSERVEDVVDTGNRGTDPTASNRPAAAPAQGKAVSESAAAAGIVDGGSHGSDPSAQPLPGTPVAVEAGHNATKEVIVGDDGRTRVTATTSYPWRSIGALTGDNGRNGLECTATLIAPLFLITAAHCVYVPNFGYLNNLRFSAGRDNAKLPYGTAKSVRASVPDAYRRLADADTSNSQYGDRRPFDWAVIKLDSAIGNRLGYFGRFRDFDNADFVMNTAGYPFDKGNEMWFSSCEHQRMSPGAGAAFPYFCDTQPGNSGGPIWINQDGRRYYIGIHTGSDGLQTNYGTRYSSEVHAFVLNAMATL